jgi:6,7-dimethyl-8-ribityllumazine synthase
MAVAHVTPVVHEVLLLDSEEQAQERCLGGRINRGAEAAGVAVNMIELFRKMEVSIPFPHPPTA